MAGLYLHIPFCSQRCSYCDFYFVTTQKSHSGFVEAICREISLRGAEFGGFEPLETIYFGGGTPSQLNLSDLGRIIEAINEAFDTSKVVETTFEINPEDASPDYLNSLRILGIDRLSIGIQSFFDDDLKFMNRIHDAAQAKSVIDDVRAAGFSNFSIDLIFGVPGQPEEYWSANLEIARSFNVPHISTYNLTIEEATPLKKQVDRGLVQPVADEDSTDQFTFTMNYLKGHGFDHYEISSFARPGFKAIHNHRYWSHKNYIGVGPSAHSFWWAGLPAKRWSNVKNLRRYEALLQQHVAPVDDVEHLSLDTLADEHIMLRLRTADGLNLNELEDRYGVDLLSQNVQQLADLEEGGFILPIRNQNVRLTDLGKTICDNVTARLLPSETPSS
ncbi:MAG: radical SAM family heme chaperone HemW [Rhodothermales bacterium]|nr:radical SAM family heme chaperone HemW [Rhodothermales bacterium]